MLDRFEITLVFDELTDKHRTTAYCQCGSRWNDDSPCGTCGFDVHAAGCPIYCVDLELFDIYIREFDYRTDFTYDYNILAFYHGRHRGNGVERVGDDITITPDMLMVLHRLIAEKMNRDEERIIDDIMRASLGA